jgi:hypothetical protein
MDSPFVSCGLTVQKLSDDAPEASHSATLAAETILAPLTMSVSEVPRGLAQAPQAQI